MQRKQAPRTILVVDDDADILRMIAAVLRNSYDVVTAQDGNAGRGRAREAATSPASSPTT